MLYRKKDGSQLDYSLRKIPACPKVIEKKQTNPVFYKSALLRYNFYTVKFTNFEYNLISFEKCI